MPNFHSLVSNECRFRFLKWMDWIIYLTVAISNNSAGRYLIVIVDRRRNEGLLFGSSIVDVVVMGYR